MLFGRVGLVSGTGGGFGEGVRCLDITGGGAPADGDGHGDAGGSSLLLFMLSK